jgi:hypothetical protein
MPKTVTAFEHRKRFAVIVVKWAMCGFLCAITKPLLLHQLREGEPTLGLINFLA